MKEKLNDLLNTAKQAIADKQYDDAALLLANAAFHSLSLLGTSQFEANGNLELAMKYLKLALEIDPTYWGSFNNIAHICNQAGHYKEAAEFINKAIELNKQSSCDPYFNGGVIFRNNQEIDRSIECYRIAEQFERKPPMTSYNLGCMLLLTQQFEEGWKLYESRLNLPEVKKINGRFEVPQWEGQPFEGKTLFIYNEQGLGDFIQFMRYLPQVKALGGQIIIECQSALTPLLAHNHFGCDVIISRTDEIPQITEPIDYVCSINSLPYLFKVDHIDGSAYIEAPGTPPPEIADCKQMKIGVAWAGSPQNSMDRLRSCHLKHFKEISKNMGVQLFGLQPEHEFNRTWSGKQIDLLADSDDVRIMDIRHHLGNLAETANCIAGLDLVIAVDTVIAHLAGAMGKPVWLLLSSRGDWRWFEDQGLDFEQANWYDSMTIFRQRDGWEALFEVVKSNLLLAVPELIPYQRA